MLLKKKGVGCSCRDASERQYNTSNSHTMATVAIGDIHGNLGPLEDLLSQVVPEMRPEDTLVFLGDYIDRGPD